jgi:hypothetical protein
LKLVDGNIYLEKTDIVEAGIFTANYFDTIKSKGVKSINYIDDPADLRKVLIEYESLKPEYKEQVKTASVILTMLLPKSR